LPIHLPGCREAIGWLVVSPSPIPRGSGGELVHILATPVLFPRSRPEGTRLVTFGSKTLGVFLAIFFVDACGYIGGPHYEPQSFQDFFIIPEKGNRRITATVALFGSDF